MSALKREPALLAALQWYADSRRYEGHYEHGGVIAFPEVVEDSGQRARDALAMVEEATR